MRRASTLAAAALAASGVLALVGPASAQSPGQPASTAGQAQGLRYLSWQGRGEATPPAARDTAQPEPPRTDLRRPNRVIPHGGFAASEEPAPSRRSAAPDPARRTLTPANAWLQPRPVAPEPAPVPVSSAVAPHAPSAPPPQPAAGPEYLPDQGRRGQPAPAEAVYPAAVPAAESSSALDPMAPRRDAPVFRMQQASPPPPAAAAAAQTAPRTLSAAEAPQPERMTRAAVPDAAAPRQGGRYYSVHRQNGREPDALTMPPPTVVEALVVSGIDTLASQDLAEPAQGPTLIRDRNGSIRPAPAASDGDHQ